MTAWHALLGRLLYLGYRYRYLAAASIVGGIVAWMIGLAASRYEDPPLMNRMRFYAAVLNLDKSQIASDARLQTQLQTLASSCSLQYAGNDRQRLFKAIRAVLESQNHDELREQLTDLKEQLHNYVDAPTALSGTEPYQKLGVDPRVREDINVPLDDLRLSAQQFVVFVDHGKYRPPQFYVFPWLYLDFYDYRRVQLNWIILGSVAALFFSLILVSETWYGDGRGTKALGGCDSACRPWRTCAPIVRPAFWAVGLGVLGVVTAWALVFCLDDPERWNEKPFDYAVSILVALLGSLIVYFIHVSTNTPLTIEAGTEMTADELVDRLQPVVWAALAMLVGIGAGAYYTLFGLIPSGKYRRAAIQSGIFFALALWLILSVYRLYRHSQQVQCKGADGEAAGDRFGDHFHRLFLPKLRYALFQMILAAIFYAAPIFAA